MKLFTTNRSWRWFFGLYLASLGAVGLMMGFLHMIVQALIRFL